ncbi:MAG: hypothetical protein ACXADA_19825, partial [Candidatus Hodarchaeales archaeon]
MEHLLAWNMSPRRKKRRSRSRKRESVSPPAVTTGSTTMDENEKENSLSDGNFTVILTDWFKKNARTFFWRKVQLTPFQSLVVELLLQKTRAETVEKFVREFLKQYPDPQAVVGTKTSELERRLQPLGLSKRRANHLKEISKTIIDEHEGTVPM